MSETAIAAVETPTAATTDVAPINEPANNAETNQGGVGNNISDSLVGEIAKESKNEAAPNDGPADQKEDEQGAAPVIPESPGGYQFNYDENVTVDQNLENDFKAMAHKSGLTQEQAQSLVSQYAGYVSGLAQKVADAQMDSVKQTLNQWHSEIQGRENYAEEKKDVERVLAAYGNPEFIKFLNETQMGSHPGFFEWVANVGRDLREPQFRSGANKQRGKSISERMWPKMK